MAQREILNKIRIYISTLEEKGISIEKVYLFGSHATDKPKKDSDIDLLIVSKEFDNETDQIVGLVWRLTKKVDCRIEPYLVGLDKFNNDEISPLLQIVKKEGIPLIA